MRSRSASGYQSGPIDYVRFYKSNSEPFYPCTPTPACLSDDAHKEDLDYSKNNATDGLPTSTSGL